MTNEHGLAPIDMRDKEIEIYRSALLKIYKSYPHDWTGKVAAEAIQKGDLVNEFFG